MKPCGGMCVWALFVLWQPPFHCACACLCVLFPQCPHVARAMHETLHRTQRIAGSWVGSSAIHLGGRYLRVYACPSSPVQACWVSRPVEIALPPSPSSCPLPFLLHSPLPPAPSPSSCTLPFLLPPPLPPAPSPSSCTRPLTLLSFPRSDCHPFIRSAVSHGPIPWV